MLRCLGITREVENSPNRENDDARILSEVLAHLSRAGWHTECRAPESIEESDADAFDLILPMCEVPSRIRRLAALSERGTALWINHPRAVQRCYRTKMLQILGGRHDVRFPPSEVRLVEDGAGEIPTAFPSTRGYWIKRGDVHNTCDHDVVFAADWRDAPAILDDFASRGIRRYLVQPHIEGDLVKFYGVGPGKWFTWFYHHPVKAKKRPFSVTDLAAQASCGAKSLGIEVFGGDAILTPDGGVTVIDLNSWPSCALVRSEAAKQIAAHLLDRFDEPARVPAGLDLATRRKALP